MSARFCGRFLMTILCVFRTIRSCFFFFQDCCPGGCFDGDDGAEDLIRSVILWLVFAGGVFRAAVPKPEVGWRVVLREEVGEV